MRMKLIRLSIQNFKGCKDRVIDFGSRTSIKGINGSGKTTIADAVMWVLFGKDSTGASSFDIRPKDADNNDIDLVDIVVEMVLEVDGKEVTIIKTQRQNWVTKKGCEEQTFQGNENKYIVNTIPKAEKEFKTYIEALVPEEVFKFVSNTNAFMAQKAVDRRKTLFKLISDMTDADVLATDPKFDSLAGQLSQFTAEEILSRDRKALLENKKKLEEIPARIDEVSKAIVEVDYSESEKKLQELREQLETLESDTSDASVYDQVNKLKTEIFKLKGELQEIERDANSKIINDRKDIQCKIIEVDQAISREVRARKGTEDEIRFLNKDIPEEEAALKKYGEEYSKEKVGEFDKSNNICPTCHREYPDDMKEIIQNDFESAKKKKLADIDQSGARVSGALKSDRAKLEGYNSDLKEINSKIEQLDTEKVKLQHELEALPVSVDLSSNAVYQVLQNSLINAEGNLDIALNMTKDADAMKQGVIEKKRAVQSEIDAVNRILSGKQTIANAKLRVEELKVEQRRLSQDIATTEREIYLLEEFNKAKVNLLSDKINAHFKIVRWKLFERQINGGYNPICEPLVNGQAYSSALNSGHKILAELDIIQALQRIYDVSVPVFLDNAERINDFNIPDMDCQLVLLKVADPVYEWVNGEEVCTYDGSLKVVNE